MRIDGLVKVTKFRICRFRRHPADPSLSPRTMILGASLMTYRRYETTYDQLPIRRQLREPRHRTRKYSITSTAHPVCRHSSPVKIRAYVYA